MMTWSAVHGTPRLRSSWLGLYRCRLPEHEQHQSRGATAGDYYDANRNTHGILRYSDNAFAEFDVPGGAGSVAGINPAGAITEEYRDENGCHGFVRTLDGTFTTIDRLGTTLTSVNTTFTTFDLPGSIFTFSQAVNPSGAITGWYLDAFELRRDFIRIPWRADRGGRGARSGPRK
jgi:hypothetical protein